MRKPIDDRSLLEKLTEEFVGVLERHTKYIIVSGFVAILHGRSRATEDIDIIIERIPLEQFRTLHEDLARTGFECIQNEGPEDLYRSYLTAKTSIRYVKQGMGLPEFELKLAKDALDEYQLKTRKKLPFTRTDFYFSSIEMNIAFKEELLKSEKDLADAKHLRIIYEGDLDEQEIRNAKRLIRETRLR